MRACAVALLALASGACGETSAPRPTRSFEIASVNGNASLEVACPPAGEGGRAAVGLARPSELVLQPAGTFTWLFSVGSFEELGGVYQAQSMTALEQGTYRIRGDSLLLAFSGSMPRTAPVGSIDGDVVELFVTQACSTDPAFPGAPLRARLVARD